MKLLYVFILSLFLFSCADNSPNCTNQGQLCEKHPEEYFKCERYEHYYNDHTATTHTTHIYIDYKVKNTEDEWTYWKTYSEMYDHYCFPGQSSLEDTKEDSK